MYHSTSSPVFLSNHVALPYSFRSLPLRPTLMLRVGPAPAFTTFISLRSANGAPSLICPARYGSLPVGSRPSCFGSFCSRVRSARTATLPAITTAAIAVCASFSPSITDPHTSGRIIACALYTYTASLCQRSFRKSGERLTHTSFQQSPGLLHSLPDLFLCSFSLAQSLCSLMLRSSTPSFTSFTQPSYFMANASLCSSGFCRQ